MSEPDEILTAVAESVMTITINRPQKLNAFTVATLRKIIEALKEANSDPGVGVVVLTGAGGRAFCAGGDVSTEDEDAFESGSGSTGAESLDGVNRELYREFRRCLKPIIARVDGYAIGGGNHLAYMCDFTIASDRSIFGQNGPRVASPAEGWIVSHLTTVVGMKRAKEIWMLCRKYSAEQALEWGLINSVVPAERLDAEVQKWADELLSLSPTVLKLIKRSFDDAIEPLREAGNRGSNLEEINPSFYASGEQQEGASAFMEKRAPDFSRFR